MKSTTLSDFRANMKKHLAVLERDHDVLILKGSNKRDFVVLTLKEYNSMAETSHLLSTDANASRLIKGIEEHKGGDITYSYKLPKTKAKAVVRGTRSID